MSSCNTQVAIVRCLSYDEHLVTSAVREVIDLLGGINKFVRPGQRVMLKPNAIAPVARDNPAITHPQFIIAVAKLVLEAGGVPVIADSPAWGNMFQWARACGLDQQAAELGVEIIQLTKAETVTVRHGSRVISLKHSHEARCADVLINLPKLKTHRQLGFSGATKNMFGTVPGRRKALWHLRASRTDLQFACKLIEHYLCLIPHLTIMDAVVIMEGNGPRLGTAKQLGAIIAGTDCVAIDHVGAEMLSLPESHRLVLNAARHLKVGCSGMEEVEIVGEPLSHFIRNDIRLPELLGTGFSPFRVLRGMILNWRQTRTASAPRATRT